VFAPDHPGSHIQATKAARLDPSISAHTTVCMSGHRRTCPRGTIVPTSGPPHLTHHHRYTAGCLYGYCKTLYRVYRLGRVIDHVGCVKKEPWHISWRYPRP
jgi:hypothetical protein